VLRQRTGGHLPAPEAILCAMVEGLQVDFDSALLIESRYFCQTAISPVAHNLMHLNQIRADLATPAALELAAALRLCYADEVRALRAGSVPEALLRNAARAAGLPPPPDTAASPASDEGEASALQLAELRARLLRALCATARQHVESGTVSGPEADLISVQLFGFPAHTGGAFHFAQHA